MEQEQNCGLLQRSSEGGKRGGRSLPSSFPLSDNDLYRRCWVKEIAETLTLNLCAQQRITFPHRVSIRLTSWQLLQTQKDRPQKHTPISPVTGPPAGSHWPSQTKCMGKQPLVRLSPSRCLNFGVPSGWTGRQWPLKTGWLWVVVMYCVP